jgi:hypothetical protein
MLAKLLFLPFKTHYPLLLMLPLIVACGSGGSSDNPSGGGQASENTPPIANAGADQNASVGATVTLNAGSSSDTDGDTLTYSWSITSRPTGSSASLDYAQNVQPRFVADTAGTFAISLVVNDGTVSSNADSVSIMVSAINTAPIANAGPNQNASVGATVVLNAGNSSDADGDTLTYSWSITSAPAGSSASLDNTQIEQPRFVTDVAGTFSISLVVNDGTENSNTDIVEISVSSGTSNNAPIANAGANQNVMLGATVALNGSGSSDADGDTLTYSWSITSRPAGSSASLDNAQSAQPRFVADAAGIFSLSLVVNDGTVGSNTDSISIMVTAINTPPVANAGPDQNASVGETVVLNAGNSSDADGDTLTYSWSISSAPAGSSASLDNTQSEQPRFVADAVGTFSVELVVNDGTANSNPDSVSIIVAAANTPPIANAGPDQNVTTGSLVTLNGSGSTDADGDTLSFTWSFPSKPLTSTVTIDDLTLSTFSFTPDVDGTYIFELEVSDGTDTSNPDQISIVSSSINSAPIADAGANQNVMLGETVTLNGNGSSDADGDPLTYLWSITSQPAGSSVNLDNTQIEQPRFIADAAGTFEIELVVNDGTIDSNADSVSVIVTETNSAPVANAGPDKTIQTGVVETLNGGNSSDADSDPLTYSWSLITRPSGSNASLLNPTSSTPSLTPDIDGVYIVQLIVNDGSENSEADTVSLTSNAATNNAVDTFDGSNPLLTTSNNTSALPDITFDSGRYIANLTDNSGDITLHYNADQGRLDAALVSFPFEFIARNIGISPLGNPDGVHTPPSEWTYNFAGVQVHTLDLNSANSSHVVVGHRGSGAHYTIEGKNTLNGSSSVNDIGANIVPNAKADLRIVGNNDRSITVYWQLPNTALGSNPDNWQTYGTDGSLPGTAPSYGSQVYVGLITYAFANTGVPFSGVCDSIEIIQN